MSESKRLQRAADEPRAATSREWELFVRETETGPLRHAGSVSAPTVEGARERAGRLFADRVTDVWLCPADEVGRFTVTDAAAEATDD